MKNESEYFVSVQSVQNIQNESEFFHAESECYLDPPSYFGCVAGMSAASWHVVFACLCHTLSDDDVG